MTGPANPPPPAPRPAPDGPHARGVAESIVRALRTRGHTAYFAGGCVRDELLGLDPADYDVATDATPDRVRELFPRSSEVGKSFGVVIVRDRGELVEVATFRSDGTYSDRRRPDDVVFSTPEADARRRDFTVNALFLDPFAPGASRVIDFVGGQQDLAARVLRAVGDPGARLAEDHLRALRAVRLAARLGFAIEPATASAIAEHAADLRGVSRERVGDELRRMLSHPTRARAAELLGDLGLAAAVFGVAGHPGPSPRLAALAPEALFPTALTGLMLDLGASEPQIPAWRDALCLSNDERDGVRATWAALRIITQDWPGLGVAARKRAAGVSWFEGARQLVAADDPARAQAVDADRAKLASTPGGLTPEPLLTGDHLIAQGWKPGPDFKRVLDGVYDAQLEGRVRTSAEARELAERLRV